MPNNIFIIGNGFDLDLGLKTKYSDFAKSEYWPKCVGFKDFLCQFLNQKKDKENWFDIEQELFNFASKEKNISPKNPESDMLFFEKLKQQLCDYITQQHNSELKKDSVAASVLNAVISNNFFDSIYSFNYTDLNLFAKKLGLSLNKSCRYIHGKVSDKTIILGVDERPLAKGYDLLHKTMSPHYRSHSIFDDLMNADEVVIFGLSFGCIDYTYFDRFFRAQSSEDRIRDDKKKNITIFTKDENSRVDILNKLKGMNVNIQNLYAQSNFQIIRTECEQDKVLLEDFCNRLDKFSYKKIGASVFVK
jgi:hypothetical protein